jgi:hypothetical protein
LTKLIASLHQDLDAIGVGVGQENANSLPGQCLHGGGKPS